MPYVNIRITRDGVTTEQKAQLVQRITDALVEVLGKKPEHTHIVIDEVDEENWGFAGLLTSEYRRRMKDPQAPSDATAASSPRTS